ncbi:MAG: DNA primase [Candidatus Bathyarchaeota archaeon]|nr:MAG: DNA primase [Candidatus Bathyarchaeota archaeon]
MGTSQSFTPKYVIQVSFAVEGVVEKSDVIGAIFGQTEGLFGPELDLHELQKSGRIGRIEIKMESKKDKTNGIITIPSSLDKPLTALIAAAIENVDRVGPCSAKVVLDKIEDVRERKRGAIIDRAKQILQRWTVETVSDVDHIAAEIYGSAKSPEIVLYGPDKLSAGPNIEAASSIIVVEGRADVANLLRSGVTNVVACQGTNIPRSLIKLIKGKEVTVLLDGDRGGDIILEALLQVANIQYIARAPRGKEVEELTPKQILHILKDKTPVKKLLEKRARPVDRAPRKSVAVPQHVIAAATELQGTLEAMLFTPESELIERLPVSELASKLKQIEGVYALIFDGIITQRIVDIAMDKGLKQVIGERISGVVKRPVNLQLYTLSEITASES